MAVGSGLISSFLVPTPVDVVKSFGMLITEEHLLQPLRGDRRRTLSAAFLATLIGGLAGWALYRWGQARLAYTSWIVGLNAAPSLLLYPLFLVIVGRNAVTIVVLWRHLRLAADRAEDLRGPACKQAGLLDVGRSFDLTAFQQFRLIQLPAAVPTIFSGVRISLINALITVVGIEFLIGYRRPWGAYPRSRRPIRDPSDVRCDRLRHPGEAHASNSSFVSSSDCSGRFESSNTFGVATFARVASAGRDAAGDLGVVGGHCRFGSPLPRRCALFFPDRRGVGPADRRSAILVQPVGDRDGGRARLRDRRRDRPAHRPFLGGNCFSGRPSSPIWPHSPQRRRSSSCRSSI